jgi:hypothetical protein
MTEGEMVGFVDEWDQQTNIRFHILLTQYSVKTKISITLHSFPFHDLPHQISFSFLPFKLTSLARLQSSVCEVYKYLPVHGNSKRIFIIFLLAFGL